MNAQQLINEISQNGKFDNDQVKDALCDGDYLASQGYTDQDLIEEAYNLLNN
jgi:hypothetical protein